MALRHQNSTGRLAFTLVELLVAMALILFIMVILSQAFVSGLESFRQLKAIGDMEERLRTAAVEIRRDLSADHFEGKRRLSDPDFWQQPTREGFFQIVQATNVPTAAGPYYLEGTDSDNNPSFRATDHRLHFSVKLRGNSQGQFFSTPIPPGTPSQSPLRNASLTTNFFNQPPDGRFQSDPNVYNSPWAEVAYFLVPTGTNAGSGVPLYSLYRSQLVVVPDNRNLNWQGLPGQPAIAGVPINASQLSNYLGFSCQPGTAATGTANNLYFNCPSDLALSDLTGGIRTLGTSNWLITSSQLNTDPTKLAIYQTMATRSSLLLTDVISFQVRILTPNAASSATTAVQDFVDLTSSAGTPANFDTGDPKHFSTPAQAANYNIVAIQVTLRVWDIKTEQARQITIIQDM